MMTHEEQENWKRKIQRKVARKNYSKLKRDGNFKLFYAELQNYFLDHNMPLQLQLVKEQQFYVMDLNIKSSKYAIKIFHENICNITILPHPIGIELFRLEIYKPGHGFGSIFMTAFNEISKKTGVVIYLILGDPGFTRGDNNIRKRQNFYQKFNFKQASLSNYWTNREFLKGK